MRDEHSEQDQALDSLLNQVKNPPAPDWFEARTLARLRREKDRSSVSWVQLWRYLAAGTAFAVVAFGLTLSMKNEGSLQGSDSVAKSAVSSQGLEEEQLFAALDAFSSYTQQAKEWHQEPY